MTFTFSFAFAQETFGHQKFLNREKNFKRVSTCIYVTESLCCTLETNTTLYINCIPIKLKYSKKFLNHFEMYLLYIAEFDFSLCASVKEIQVNSTHFLLLFDSFFFYIFSPIFYNLKNTFIVWTLLYFVYVSSDNLEY